MSLTAIFDTARGPIRVELLADKAPLTVANFVNLARRGFYDGLAFHRVIPDFVIQGGCPNTKAGASGMPGTGGPGWKIKCETAGNPHKHKLGALSMAHAGPNTGGSQFFICNGSAPSHLDGVHTVFGQCAAEADIQVVKSIKANDRIVKATVVEA